MAKIRMANRTPFNLQNMCTPATIYFVISVVALVILGLYNLNTPDQLCIGEYNCYVGNNTVVFILNAVYIIFWKFILDLMCKNGYSDLSWLIILLPIILTFVFYAMIMIKMI